MGGSCSGAGCGSGGNGAPGIPQGGIGSLPLDTAIYEATHPAAPRVGWPDLPTGGEGAPGPVMANAQEPPTDDDRKIRNLIERAREIVANTSGEPVECKAVDLVVAQHFLDSQIRDTGFRDCASAVERLIEELRR